MSDKTYLKVIDREGLVRDPETKAILANDHKQLHEHREKARFFKSLLEKNQEVDQLKQDMGEMKAMLNQILAAINNK